MAWQNYMKECKEYFENNPVEIEGKDSYFTPTLLENTLYFTWYDEYYIAAKRIGHYNPTYGDNREIMIIPPFEWVSRCGLPFEHIGGLLIRAKNYYLMMENFPEYSATDSQIFCVPIISQNWNVILNKLVNPYKSIVNTSAGLVLQGEDNEPDFD